MLDPKETDALAQAADEVHRCCLEAVGHVVANGLYSRLRIHPALIPAIEATWELSGSGAAGTLYGRIDLAYDGVAPPKFLEYNAESPTSALEADRGQRLWLAARGVPEEPFADLTAAMTARWREIVGPDADGPVVFLRDRNNAIDEAAASFMQGCAEQAGLSCAPLDLDLLTEWLKGRPASGAPPWLFKLIRWDLLLEYVLDQPDELVAKAVVLEPPWKAILTSKHILPLLHEMFPGHPNILAAAEQRDAVRSRYVVRKPARGMAQMNIAVLDGDTVVAQSDGGFDDSEVVYQEYAPPADCEGFHPVFGCWIVGAEARGVGIVEFAGELFGEHRWVPHVVGR
jgi:glutathionylspermidine synthase